MIHLPLSSLHRQNSHSDSFSSDNRAVSTNQQEAAFTSIATSGYWASLYMDLVVPCLPKLPNWPASRGLVIVEGDRANFYDAAGSRSIDTSDININNDVVLKKINNNHYNLLLPGGERAMAADGDCFFRAVIIGLNGHNLESSAIGEHIQDLRTSVAEYVFERWGALKNSVRQEDDPELENSPYEQLNYWPSQVYSLQGGLEVDKSAHVYSSFSQKVTPPPPSTSKIPPHDPTFSGTSTKTGMTLKIFWWRVLALAGITRQEPLTIQQVKQSNELIAMFKYRTQQAILESHRINKLNVDLREDDGIYENDSWPEETSIASQVQDAFSDRSTPGPAKSKTTRAVGQLKSASETEKPSMVTILMNQLEATLAPVLDAIRGTRHFNVKEMDGLAKTLQLINRSMAEAPPSEKALWAERGLRELFSCHPGNQLSKAESILKHRDVPALKSVAYELMIFMQDAAREFMGDGKDSAISQSSSPETATSRMVNEFKAIIERLQDEYGMAF